MSSLLDLKALRTIYDVAVQVLGLNSDVITIIDAIMESAGGQSGSTCGLKWDDADIVRVRASSDNPARVIMCGVPNPYGGLAAGSMNDNALRQVTADVTLDMTSAASRWGSRKTLCWYQVLAIAGDDQEDFDLKAMPYGRVKTDAAGVISLGSQAVPSNGIGYGFTTDELVGGQILILTGSSQGQLRTIAGNNNDDATGGVITYAPGDLALSQSDWFAIMPPTNHRWLLDVFNDTSDDLAQFIQDGNRVKLVTGLPIALPIASTIEDVRACPPMARTFYPYLDDWDEVSEADIILYDPESNFRVLIGHGVPGTPPVITRYSTTGLPVTNCQYRGGDFCGGDLLSIGWDYRPEWF